eukprot:TRINITY_DN13076_c0_g1_i1.p1 TRINITY_DN13076_c0_g1~~TRINITY_DN13076_c0_g1_i1.p1  ORF type:complete len:677 (+),score=154.41 TRINITY_DN13076_c0_g1_i1:31-2031(+)
MESNDNILNLSSTDLDDILEIDQRFTLIIPDIQQEDADQFDSSSVELEKDGEDDHGSGFYQGRGREANLDVDEVDSSSVELEREGQVGGGDEVDSLSVSEELEREREDVLSVEVREDVGRSEIRGGVQMSDTDSLSITSEESVTDSLDFSSDSDEIVDVSYDDSSDSEVMIGVENVGKFPENSHRTSTFFDAESSGEDANSNSFLSPFKKTNGSAHRGTFDMGTHRRNSYKEKIAENDSAKREILNEMIETGRNYNEGLDLVVEEFMPKVMESNSITEREFQILFNNIEAVREVSHIFWNEMQKISVLQFGDFISNRINILFSEYAKYCSEYSSQQALLLKLIAENLKFKKCIQSVSQNHDNMELESFLVMPVQRICKYPLFIKEFIGKSRKESREYEVLCQAFDSVNSVIQKMNKITHIKEEREKLTLVDAKIYQDNVVEIIKPRREFIFEAPLIYLKPPNMKKLGEYVFLFSDILLICDYSTSEKSKGKPFTLVKVIEFGYSTIQTKNGLQPDMLVIQVNQYYPEVVTSLLTFIAPSEKDLSKWRRKCNTLKAILQEEKITNEEALDGSKILQVNDKQVKRKEGKEAPKATKKKDKGRKRTISKTKKKQPKENTLQSVTQILTEMYTDLENLSKNADNFEEQKNVILAKIKDTQKIVNETWENI